MLSCSEASAEIHGVPKFLWPMFILEGELFLLRNASFLMLHENCRLSCFQQ